MGSPSSRLKTKESLRPWVESGLEYVLSPGGSQSASSGQQPQLETTTSQQAPPASPPVQPRSTPAQGREGNQTPQPQQAPPQKLAGIKSQFPEPWATAQSKVPANGKVFLTYMELGLDFGGQSDAKRRTVLHNMITYLDWKGVMTFWPMSGLVDGTLQPNPDMFWKGWDQTRTPNIICLGEEALRVILPDAEPGNTTYLYEHVTVQVLPAMAKLTTMLPHELYMAFDALKGMRF